MPEKNETVMISMRLDKDLMQEIDAFAAEAGMNRTSTVSLMLNMSLNLMDRLLHPEKWLIEPSTVEAIERLADREVKK